MEHIDCHLIEKSIYYTYAILYETINKSMIFLNNYEYIKLMVETLETATDLKEKSGS